MTKTKKPNVSAGSMADIAFLLLVFFLIATTIEHDEGIRRKLPSNHESVNAPVPRHNVLAIHINKQNQIMVNEKEIVPEMLKYHVIQFVNNWGVNKGWSDSPKKSVISINASIATSYDTYIQVQNSIATAYRELRDRLSIKKYGVVYNELQSKEAIADIRKEYPMNISETDLYD